MTPGIITKPDSEVLDLQRLLLADLLNRDNLASGLLELPQLPQEVPEPGLGHNLVRGEDPHPANTRIDEAGSKTSLRLMIWQRKEFHLYKGVTGSDSVGIFLPITLYSFRVPLAFILPSERRDRLASHFHLQSLETVFDSLLFIHNHVPD